MAGLLNDMREIRRLALNKAATYYEMWLSLKSPEIQPAEFLRTVGQMYFKLKDYES